MAKRTVLGSREAESRILRQGDALLQSLGMLFDVGSHSSVWQFGTM